MLEILTDDQVQNGELSWEHYFELKRSYEILKEANAEKVSALLGALDLIKRNYMVTMGAMAVPEEIERSWRDRCRTTPELRGIFDALGEKP